MNFSDELLSSQNQKKLGEGFTVQANRMARLGGKIPVKGGGFIGWNLIRGLGASCTWWVAFLVCVLVLCCVGGVFSVPRALGTCIAPIAPPAQLGKGRDSA